jgi:hypothetical protein
MPGWRVSKSYTGTSSQASPVKHCCWRITGAVPGEAGISAGLVPDVFSLAMAFMRTNSRERFSG